MKKKKKQAASNSQTPADDVRDDGAANENEPESPHPTEPSGDASADDDIGAPVKPRLTDSQLSRLLASQLPLLLALDADRRPKLRASSSRLAAQSPPLIFLALWLLFLLAGRSAMFYDPGTFWHVADGMNMLSTGQLLHADPFSFTFDGKPWVDDQWLAELGMAKIIFSKMGWDGLLLLTSTLLAGLFAWIAARLLRGGLHFLLAMLALAVTIMACTPQFHVRPLIVTMIFLGATFALLVDVESEEKRFRRLWLLVPLFILWTNMHGGVLGGLGTVAIWLVGYCAVKPSAKRLWPSLALFAALAITPLCNPYGIQLPQDWLHTMTMPLPQLIVEHGRLNLLEPIGIASVLLLIVYSATLYGALTNDAEDDFDDFDDLGEEPLSDEDLWKDDVPETKLAALRRVVKRLHAAWLLPLVWFALAVWRTRNAPLFAIVTAIALADVLQHSRVGYWLGGRGWFFARRPPIGLHAFVLPTMWVALAVGIQWNNIQLPPIGHDWAEFSPSRWPMELRPHLDAIADEAVYTPYGSPERRVFNDMNFGGFLIYFEPGLKPFIDDRCSLYGERFLCDYDLARRENPAKIAEWRKQYDFRHALVIADGQFDRYLAASPDWKLVARTPVAALYRYQGKTAAN